MSLTALRILIVADIFSLITWPAGLRSEYKELIINMNVDIEVLVCTTLRFRGKVRGCCCKLRSGISALDENRNRCLVRKLHWIRCRMPIPGSLVTVLPS